ncbi:M16 family metallopeptidase [Novosphingobium album (ex Hu et al. 2023)]|uniref:Insulinase family protein n=1 Tax=Novosphingobium album (ex Hu et al. 2023) TaxID=2930093 RepID=A0ABT0AZL8_9SPHN|nr:pitrilysin family protein [Novosphingobium album (ex Hu et al. 2023)]MCJ2178227.1 insulinase family protein [Novosphingobium album (ex Hu et al. 2023)]
MKMILAFATATAALAMGIAAVPDAVAAREAPPAPAAPRPFTLPQMTAYALPNGMQVTLIPYGNVPKATILAGVYTGNIDDGANVWLADMTGALMQKGAGGRDASQLADLAAGMGGSLSLSTGLNLTTAAMDVLSEDAPQAIGLIADLLQRPDLKAGELEKVRADLLRNLSVAKSTPDSIAEDAFASVIYPDHPYGRVFPTQKQLAGYTLDQVKGFHAANFGAARTHFYVVGRFDEGAVRAAIENAFGGWMAGAAPTALPSPVNTAPRVILIDRPGAPQSMVMMGQRVDKPGADVDFKAANTLLGGYFSSRITRNIREDKGYTYSPHASLSDRVEGASWAESAAVTAASTGPAITEIYKEIRRMQDEPPTAAEVQGIKNYMNGTFVIGLASRKGMANSLATLDLLGLGAGYMNAYVGKVSALTPADLQAAVKRELPIGKMSMVVVGPLDSVRPQLEKVPEIASELPK